MKYLSYLLVTIVACSCLLIVVVQAADQETISWSNPSVKAVRKVSQIDSSQHEPNFLNNLDCTLMDYRLVAGTAMQTGCFTRTAFGLFESDSNVAIFNGTDEGLPVLAYGSHEVLAPWPQAVDLVVLDPANTGGVYLRLYKNPLNSLRDQRNLAGQLTAKKLIAPPNLSILDPAGKQLVVNPQTIAFSDGGEWLVAETLSGSFVRVNLATLDILAFAPSFGATGSPALFESRVAISNDGKYAAIASKADNSFRVYDLTKCSGATVNLQPKNCQFYDYRPFIGQQIGGFQSVRHLRFVNSGLLSFEAQTSNETTKGVYVIAPISSIDSLIDYLALGDSYTSGEGAFDYMSGTDLTNNMCHLSANSYPVLLTNDLFSNAGGHSVACSGAVINDIGSKSSSYRGQASGVVNFEQLRQEQTGLLNSIMTNYLPGYVAQQRFVSQYQPKILTVSIGGNDVGFGSIIQNCVIPHVSQRRVDTTCYSTYEDRAEIRNLIDRTMPRWTALYRQLVSQAPSTHLYAIGYPSIVDHEGNCALNVHLNKDELQFAEELIQYLNEAIESAATKANVNYIDIGQALDGHRLCETSNYNVAVNGLTAGKDAGLLGIKVFGKESYHPNILGQRLIEQTILSQTRNFTYSSKAASTRNAQLLLSAPKTGRKIVTKVPVSNMTDQVIKKGQRTAVLVSGAETGLKANTAYEMRLNGATGVYLDTVVTSSEADIKTTVTIPNNFQSGSHTLDVIGPNQTDEAADFTQPIYVPVDDSDTDGDGLTDYNDSCPSAIDIYYDADQDGIDDTCDGLIGDPAGAGIAGTTNTLPKPLNNDTPTRAANIKMQSSLGQELGVVTSNPTTTAHKSLVVPSIPNQGAGDLVSRQTVLQKHLYVVLWLWLLVMAWLFLLLASLLIRYVDESEIRGSERVLV